MKEISLKINRETKGVPSSIECPKESYPSFSMYEKAPEELMKCEMGCELTAKIKLTSKDMHEGQNARKSVGFDVISIMMPDDKPTGKNTTEALNKAKAYVEEKRKEKFDARKIS